MDNRLSEIYRKAARLVRQGWTQGRNGDEDGNVCASQALWQSGDTQDDYHTAYFTFVRLTGIPQMTIWNDFVCTTPEEVAVMFEQCADALEQEVIGVEKEAELVGV